MEVNSKHPEPGIEWIVHEHLPGQREKFFEGKNKEIWRVSTRTNSRRGKVVECHQSTGMKRFLLTAFI